MDLLKDNSDLKFIKKFYKLIGIWSFGVSKQPLYHLYACSFHFIFTFLYFLSMWMNAVLAFEINDLYIYLAVLAAMIKCYNIFSHQQEIHHILETFREHPSFQVNEMDEEEVQIVERRMKLFSKISTIYQRMSLMACSMAILAAFEYPRSLAFPAWFPFGWTDMTVSRNFYGVFVYQTFGMIVLCLMNVTWDNLLIFVMMNTRMHFELMNKRLRMGFLIVTERNTENLKRIFRDYGEIMKINEQVEEIFETGIFMQFSMSSVILCTTVIIMTQMSPTENPAETLHNVFFLMAMINQILLPCYFGNDVTVESVDLRDAIYRMNWLEMPVQDRKLVIKFQERLKRPARITAFKYFGLNLVSFSKIINTAYSFFALLKNAN